VRQQQRHWLNMAVLIALMILPLNAFNVAAQDAGSAPDSASADAFVAPKFNIRPAEGSGDDWLRTELAPGQSGELTARIANFGEVDAGLRIWTGDAYSMVNGGFAIRNEDDPVESTGTWIAFTPEEFTLAPGESTTRTLTVTVPADATPGQYIAGVAARTQPLDIPGSTTFRQIIQSSLAIEIIVPGPINASFKLGAPSFFMNENVRSLSVPVINTGNIRVRPAGTLTMFDAAVKEVLTADVAMSSVYAGQETVVQVSVPMQLPLGEYLVSLDVTDPDTGATGSIEKVKATLEPAADVVIEEQPFTIDSLSITPNGDPVQYVDVEASITNRGQAIPTADVTLIVKRDGELVEEYNLASNTAIASGTTPFSARYIPAGGWQTGTYSFQFTIYAINAQDQSRTELASLDAPEPMVVP